MPVEGLPVTLESMLNAAMQEMALSSFKVEGRGKQTVVVIRFTQDNRHCHVAPVQDRETAAYRRKSPSTQVRDKNRAEAYRLIQKEKKDRPKEDVSSPSDLFLPTPPTLLCSENQTEDHVFASDIFSFDNAALPSSSDNKQEAEQQIDLPHDDTDRQTVTKCSEEERDSREDRSTEGDDGSEWVTADSHKGDNSQPQQQHELTVEERRMMAEVQKLADTMKSSFRSMAEDWEATSGTGDAASKTPDDDKVP